jgi:hypothetical protein
VGRTPILLLATFVAWSAVTALWVEVPANLVYELIQYLPLAALLILLVGWGERDPRVPGVIARGLAASLGLVTLIGFLQLAMPIPWLPPIDPQFGVSNPSLMGYKNPMALALLGQVWLVGWLAAGGSPRRRWPWGLLLAAELVYLATLQSRTAYAALAVSAVLFGVVFVTRPGLPGRTRARALAGALVGLVVGGALFAAAVALHPGARARVASAARYAANPGEYLASDRGTYLRNTLHMVRHRPYGVGLGDWQTWYPLFRRHDRYRSFSETVQVRRAHGDLVQLLGETGWSGLALWLGFLAAATASALRRYLRHGDPGGLFAGVQLAAMAIAMGSDYAVEMPYHKLQLFLVAAVALIRPAPGAGGPGSPARAPAPAVRRTAGAAAAAVTLAAVAAAGWSVSTLVRSVHAAALERGYLALVAGAEPAAALPRAELERLAGTGERLLAWPGHSKTLYRDLLILAHVHALRGEPARAVALARRGLDLHPHSPNGLGLLAELLEDCDPAAARAYRRARDYVMHEARDGRPPALPAKPRHTCP